MSEPYDWLTDPVNANLRVNPDLNVADAAAFHEGWRAGLQAARDAIRDEITAHPDFEDYIERVGFPGLRRALIVISQIRPKEHP